MRETDLRVVKTRANIRRCFLELLQEKALNKISLQELCRRAQCSRNTFYMHYQYIDTLYEQLVDECIISLTKSLNIRSYTPHLKNIFSRATSRSSFSDISQHNAKIIISFHSHKVNNDLVI